MDAIKKFEQERSAQIKRIGKNKELKSLGRKFVYDSSLAKYHYNFSWLGRPIIQYPQDIVAIQELIWECNPDLIIETGIAHGGSVILSASILELLGGRGKVLGIDVDIRSHNRQAIENHRMYRRGRIAMIEGSSVDPATIAKVQKIARGKKNVLVFLDSSHAEAHVLRELELYSPFVNRGSYIVVFDTAIEYVGAGAIIKDRPWKKGSNPKTAVDTFLKKHKNFILDETMESKLLITSAPGGYLKRVR